MGAYVTHAGSTQSIWMATQTLPTFNALAADAEADVCIIGAGIAGLSAAYQLARAGRSVIVIDDGPIVSGETERTTAHLANAIDDRFDRQRGRGEQQGSHQQPDRQERSDKLREHGNSRSKS